MGTADVGFDLKAQERARVLRLAEQFVSEQPQTITAFPCPQSAGGLHDYYSQGDYWWPNPDDPGGPFVRRDGFAYPHRFELHRLAMRRMAIMVPALTAAFVLTKEREYADAAARHLRAWFVDEKTKMHAHLHYGQAIPGVTSGRCIGIVDTIHLAEVALASWWLLREEAIDADDVEPLRTWFRDYRRWLTDSDMGREERDQANNHSTCWDLQVASFAWLNDERDVLDFCRLRFRQKHLQQMDAQGCFPLEVARGKPYNYSIFNMDLLAGLCQVLSEAGPTEWNTETPEGYSVRLAAEFLAPYIADKSRWPYPRDVEFADELPVRQPFLLFCGIAYHRNEWLETWKRLESDPAVEEIIRNLPIRQPLLWYFS